MNVIDLYGQLATTWERARADVLSHVIAIALLLLVGFRPPLPTLDINDLAAIQDHPLYKMFQGIGFLALVSLGVALGLWLYAVALRKVGQLVLIGLMVLFPPTFSTSDWLRRVPRRALFNVAATFEGGTYQASDMTKRIFELAEAYSTSRKEELNGFLSAPRGTQRDAIVYFQNAAVFVVAWISAWWFLPAASPLAVSIDAVFWRGLLVLVLFVLVARRRYLFVTSYQLLVLTMAVAQLVKSDNTYSDRLAVAQANPKPYMDFVDRAIEAESNSARDFQPSLPAYLKARLNWQTIALDRKSILEMPFFRKLRDFSQKLNDFGWNEQANRDYDDPLWLLRYVGWRVARALGLLWMGVRKTLMGLGLWKP